MCNLQQVWVTYASPMYNLGQLWVTYVTDAFNKDYNIVIVYVWDSYATIFYLTKDFS